MTQRAMSARALAAASNGLLSHMVDDIRVARKRVAAKRFLRDSDCGGFIKDGLSTSDLVYLCKLVRDSNKRIQD